MLRLLYTGLLSAGILLAIGCTRIIHSMTDEPIRPDPGETSLGTDLNDWQIETYVGVNIKKADPRLENAHINIHAYNGVVLLTGEVPAQELRGLAGDTARNFRGVRQVHNELQVRPRSTALQRTNDLWLKTKVRTKLIAEKNFDSSDIKVVIENKVVYLMGIVTHKQGQIAATIASTTAGVERVVKAFEYLD